MLINDLYSGAAASYLPERRSHVRLAQAIPACRECALWEQATHAVIGRGRISTGMMLVGEQPGDQEDRAAAPFVGPAGRMLNRALAASGMERDEVYVTNVVKHFKWTPRGKRRLHQRPSREEVDACAPWLAAEIDLVRPDVLVLLGATAAQALLGSSFRITRQRGVDVTNTGLAPHVLATAHPSSILRVPAGDGRRAAFAELVADLQAAARLQGDGSSG
jgi:uracil-DNA glycosylase